jgi:DNA-binding transcriptional LysR family regulator
MGFELPAIYKEVCALDIKIGQLKQVLAIAEHGSFSQAARKLFISQPSLSESIKKLENSLGIALFDRTSNPIRLTDAGELYVKTASHIVELSNEMEQELNDIENFPQGRVIVGSSQFVTTYIMPHILTSLRMHFPKIHVSLVEILVGKEREEAAMKGSIHLFFTTSHTNDTHLECSPIMRERLLLALPQGHRLNAPDAITTQERTILPAIRSRPYPLEDLPPGSDFPSISLKKLKGDPFVLLRSSLSMPRMVLDMFDKCGFVPEVMLESQSISATHSMAMAGLGNAFIPESLVRYNDYRRHPVYYQIEPFFPIRDLSIAYHKKRYHSQAMRVFIEVAREVLKAPVVSLPSS